MIIFLDYSIELFQAFTEIQDELFKISEFTELYFKKSYFIIFLENYDSE